MPIPKRQQWLLDRVKLQQVVADPSQSQNTRQKAKSALDNLDMMLLLDGVVEKKQPAKPAQQPQPSTQQQPTEEEQALAEQARQSAAGPPLEA